VKDPECSAVVKVVNGQFQNVAPKDKPWLCWNTSDTWAPPVPTEFH
jgi:hypothetical protein